MWMDAKFSDAHALGHKKDSSPKIHILFSNPEQAKPQGQKNGVHRF